MQDHHQSRADKFLKKVFPLCPEWWERKPTVFKLSDTRVREKLTKLMGTDLVRLSDREFMKKLRSNRQKLYQKVLDKRIDDRLKWEVERKKRLVLEGVAPVPEGLQITDHPICRLTDEVDIIINERQNLLDKKQRRKKRVPEFNYRLLERDAEEASTPSQVSLISEQNYLSPDVVEANREVVREVLVEEFEAGYMADRKTMEMFVYTPPEVKRLRDSTTVDEMYRAAEMVLRKIRARGENEGSDESIVGEEEENLDADKTEVLLLAD